MKKYLLLTLLGLLVFSTRASQTCSTNVVASTPTNRFATSGATIIDNATGLTWMRCSLGQTGDDCNGGNAKSYTWSGALNEITNNHSSWRLPNIKELNSIIELRCHAPAINKTVFPNTKSNDYWSSSPDADYADYAWSINFNDGNAGNDMKHASLFVRLVKDTNGANSSNQPIVPITKYSHVAGYQGKCVKDNKTGLTWEVKQHSGLHSKDNTYSWYSTTNNGGNAGKQNGGACSGSGCDTAAFVNAVNSGGGWCGKTDWRLPTRKELKTLVDKSQTPTIDLTYFPQTKSWYYWSSSPHADDSSYAWVVAFDYGYGSSYKGSNYYVRLVRGSSDH